MKNYYKMTNSYKNLNLNHQIKSKLSNNMKKTYKISEKYNKIHVNLQVTYKISYKNLPTFIKMYKIYSNHKEKLNIIQNNAYLL